MEPDSSEPTDLEAALTLCFVALFTIVIVVGILGWIINLP